ncbi:MAG: LysR family transcriptional regulator, partial [Myxococcales bacterium]|nr:LysR family transcriptional regulator [Myxococcales bacterium]
MPGDDELLFLRVGDAGSLKAAAYQLGVDPSTVSRRVRSLEERVGARLLRRSTRRTGPTDAGLRYSEGLRRLVDEQQALEADVSGETRQIRGILRIAAPVGFGARFVVPVVDRMMAESPELEVALELGSDAVDLVERGLDVAVRVGRLQDSALRARRLASVPRVIVAGPAWVARHGMPTTAEELEALPGRPWIAYRRSGGVPTFPLTCPDGRTLDQPVRAGIHVNSVEGMRALVLAGRGL